MDISVIIPCYNLEEYIERCLFSVINQDYDKDKFEIILVLDSCTDTSQDKAIGILSQCAVKSYIILADVQNAGLARNIGLEMANGEFIYFVDGDDYLTDSGALTKLTARMAISDSNVVYMTAFECEDPTVTETDAIWRFFYKRSIIGKTKFLCAPINEDWIFVRDIKRKSGYKESKIDDILYHYTHPRKGSITEKYELLSKQHK